METKTLKVGRRNVRVGTPVFTRIPDGAVTGEVTALTPALLTIKWSDGKVTTIWPDGVRWTEIGNTPTLTYR